MRSVRIDNFVFSSHSFLPTCLRSLRDVALKFEDHLSAIYDACPTAKIGVR